MLCEQSYSSFSSTYITTSSFIRGYLLFRVVPLSPSDSLSFGLTLEVQSIFPDTTVSLFRLLWLSCNEQTRLLAGDSQAVIFRCNVIQVVCTKTKPVTLRPTSLDVRAPNESESKTNLTQSLCCFHRPLLSSATLQVVFPCLDISRMGFKALIYSGANLP